MWHQTAITLVGIFFALPGSAEAIKASFDCSQARSPVEVAVCKSPELAALDRAVDAAYKAALRRLDRDKNAQKALRDEQRLFLEAREQARQREDYGGLGSFMDWRRKKLAQITQPQAGYEGLWIDGYGEVRISRRPDGSFAVKADAGEWITARWVCQYEGTGRLQGGHVAVSTNEPDDDYGLKLIRAGSVLLIEETSRNETPTGSPYCGMGGRLSGVYFAAKAKLDPSGSE